MIKYDWEKKKEVFRVRTGQALFRDIRSRWDRGVDRFCVLCREESETEEHIILECPELGEEREWMLEVLHHLVGQERWARFLALDKIEQMTWVLGLNAEIAGVGRGGVWMKVFEWVGRIVYHRYRVG